MARQSQEEVSAATFLSAVKSRLIEWGKAGLAAHARARVRERCRCGWCGCGGARRCTSAGPWPERERGSDGATLAVVIGALGARNIDVVSEAAVVRVSAVRASRCARGASALQLARLTSPTRRPPRRAHSGQDRARRGGGRVWVPWMRSPDGAPGDLPKQRAPRHGGHRRVGGRTDRRWGSARRFAAVRAPAGRARRRVGVRRMRVHARRWDRGGAPIGRRTHKRAPCGRTHGRAGPQFHSWVALLLP